jgi:hypothetical protein
MSRNILPNKTRRLHRRNDYCCRIPQVIQIKKRRLKSAGHAQLEHTISNPSVEGFADYELNSTTAFKIICPFIKAAEIEVLGAIKLNVRKGLHGHNESEIA